MATLTTVRATPQQAPTRRAARPSGRPGVVWALPGLAFFAVFAILPMLVVAYLSLTRWDGLSDPEFIGLENWTKFFSDPLIGPSTGITAVLLVGNIVVQMPLAILLGVWAAGPQRNRAVLTTIFFLPLLLSGAATAIMWQQMLDPNFGIPSKVPWLFGGDGSFVGTSTGAPIAIILVMSWQFIPFHSLLFQGAARSISPTLYQAAMIDGAGTVRQFFSITLPQLRNTFITSLTFMVVGGLTAFDVILVLTNGGPGTDTTTLPLWMYKSAFNTYTYGYASVVAVVLLVLATLVSLVLVKVSGYDRMESTQEGL